jgi:hypothetical protein
VFKKLTIMSFGILGKPDCDWSLTSNLNDRKDFASQLPSFQVSGLECPVGGSASIGS